MTLHKVVSFYAALESLTKTLPEPKSKMLQELVTKFQAKQLDQSQLFSALQSLIGKEQTLSVVAAGLREGYLKAVSPTPK